MGVLTWLRSVGTPWLGSAKDSPAAVANLDQERVRVRTGAAGGKYRFYPYIDNLTGETAAHRRAYRKMLAEPNIKAALLDKVLSVAALDLSVNPGEEDGDATRQERNRQAAAFGLHLLNRLTGGDYGLTGLPAFVETVILPGLIDGFSVTEKIACLETRGKWAGKVVLKLKNKDTADDLTFALDDFNNITGIVGQGVNSGQEYDVANFVIWRHLSIFDSPGGMSDLRAAYRAWMMIDTVTKLRAIYLEKFSAGPMLVGKYTDSGTEKSQLEDGLEAARAQTWLSIPAQAQIEALNLAVTNGEQAFKACLDDLKHEVFLGISGAILQALEGSTTEGRGSSAIHKSTADIRKWHISACVTSVLNSQILPDAIDLNFVGVATPVATLGGVDDGELAASLAIDRGMLVEMKVPLSRKDLYKRYGRSMPLDEADTVKPPEMGGVGLALPGLGAETAPDTTEQADAVAGSDLRTTVGGLNAIATLQAQYYEGKVPREAAIANVQLLFGFDDVEAGSLFPEIAPVKLTPEEGAPPPLPGVQLAEPAPEVPVAEPFRESSQPTSWGYAFSRDD